MMGAEHEVRRMWQGRAGIVGRLVRISLWPLSVIYRISIGVRNAAYGVGLLPSYTAQIPVISVGNLTVGGTGKTPVSGWIVGELLKRDLVPALVARGYGRDELLLHARWNPAASVIASPNRVDGVQVAADRGATIAVLDDAFQHRRIRRDLDVVLLAAETPFPGALLPRGPYREGARSLGRADLVVVTRKSASEEEAIRVEKEVTSHGFSGPVVRVHLRPDGFADLNGTILEHPDGPVTVVTGVADPESVRRSLENEGMEVSALETYPDHHDFSESDLERIRSRAASGTVIVTEKDAVKLETPGFEGLDVRVLRLRVMFESGEAELRNGLDRVLEARKTP